MIKGEETLSADHPSRLGTQHALAIVHSTNGQVKKAVDLLEIAMEFKTRVVRVDHPSLLVSIEVLTEMYAELAVKSDEALSSSSLDSRLCWLCYVVVRLVAVCILLFRSCNYINGLKPR
jgi:hypothetical protein